MDIGEFMVQLIIIGLFFVFFVVPILMFIPNFINLFNRGKKNRFFAGIYNKRRKLALASFIVGIVLTLIALVFISDYSWYESVILNPSNLVNMHEPFSSEHMLSFTVFAIVALWCCIILDGGNLLPPLVATICIGGVYMGVIFSGLYMAQLMENLINRDACSEYRTIIPYLLLYALNYLVCAVRIIRETIILYTQYYDYKNIEIKFKLVKKIQNILKKSTGWVWFPIICIIPITGLLLCICFICGQGAWGIIKAFTETSDWTFSTMISPPPVEYQGHYLCTVAVNGHKKIVKPTRLGIRHGIKIGVNRQLCVANAFEQLIEEKSPHFHKVVRRIYDKYGYPISKHISTKLRADIIYIIMKPLELIFIVTLYLFDIDPESRISVQYTGEKLEGYK